jgi:hypothetical protein
VTPQVEPSARRHPGLRHGALLTLCLVVPATYAVGAAAALRVEGFPTWGVVLLVAAVAVGAGVTGVEGPRPGLTGIAARLVGAAVLALGVRLTVPTPARALAEVRDGDAYLVSGAALVVFAALVVGAIAGHVVTGRTVEIARGRPTVEAARSDDRQLLTSAWGTGLTLAVLAGLTHRSAGAVGQLLLLAGLAAGLLVVADLRRRIPAPGAARPAIVARPRSVQLGAITLASAVVIGVTAVAVPALPNALSEGLGRPSEWVAERELDWDPRRAPAYSPGGEREQLLDRNRLDRWRLLWLPEPDDLVVPPWVQVVVLTVLGIGLLLVLRPDRWGPTLRRMVAALRARGGEDEDDFEALRPLEDEGRDADGRTSRLRDALDRVRPRPRDPRQAILHDYLRVDRLLARGDRGRRAAETPLEHATRVHVGDGDGGLAALVELADLVGAARYGRREPSEVAAARSRELQQLLDHELRARPHAR